MLPTAIKMPGYITVSVTDVESEPLPEVAVTTIGYVPAGVPVCVLTCCPDDELPAGAPQAVKPTAIRSNEARTNCGASRSPPRMARSPRPSTMPNAAIHNAVMGKDRRGKLGETGNEAVECAIVVMESVTGVFPLPAGIVAGENDAVTPEGNGVATAKVTALAVVVFAGTTMRVKFASWPAVTEVIGVTTFTLKSSTINVNAEVVPPPGAGLLTEILREPLWAKSVAGSTALSEVEPTYVVARELPLTRTVELVLKFVPVTLTVTAALPAGSVEGTRLLVPGNGLFTVNVVTSDGLPPGFATVTNGVPAAAIAAAGIAACNCV